MAVQKGPEKVETDIVKKLAQVVNPDKSFHSFVAKQFNTKFNLQQRIKIAGAISAARFHAVGQDPNMTIRNPEYFARAPMRLIFDEIDFPFNGKKKEFFEKLKPLSKVVDAELKARNAKQTSHATLKEAKEKVTALEKELIAKPLENERINGELEKARKAVTEAEDAVVKADKDHEVKLAKVNEVLGPDKQYFREFFNDFPKEKMKNVIQTLLPFYHEYMVKVENDCKAKSLSVEETNKRMLEAKETFRGHISFPFVETEASYVRAGDGFDGTATKEMPLAVRFLREQGLILESLISELDEANKPENYVAPNVDDLRGQIEVLYNEGEQNYVTYLEQEKSKIKELEDNVNTIKYVILQKLAKGDPNEKPLTGLLNKIAFITDDVNKLKRKGTPITDKDIEETFNHIVAAISENRALIDPIKMNKLMFEAAAQGNVNTLKALISIGEDMTAVNENGLTALEVAKVNITPEEMEELTELAYSKLAKPITVPSLDDPKTYAMLKDHAKQFHYSENYQYFEGMSAVEKSYNQYKEDPSEKNKLDLLSNINKLYNDLIKPDDGRVGFELDAVVKLNLPDSILPQGFHTKFPLKDVGEIDQIMGNLRDIDKFCKNYVVASNAGIPSGDKPILDSPFPIHQLVKNSNIEFNSRTKELLGVLVKHKDINQKDPAGQTPLQIAAMQGNSSVISELLKAGANPKLTTTNYKRGFLTKLGDAVGSMLKGKFKGAWDDAPPRTAGQIADISGNKELAATLLAKERTYVAPPEPEKPKVPEPEKVQEGPKVELGKAPTVEPTLGEQLGFNIGDVEKAGKGLEELLGPVPEIPSTTPTTSGPTSIVPTTSDPTTTVSTKDPLLDEPPVLRLSESKPSFFVEECKKNVKALLDSRKDNENPFQLGSNEMALLRRIMELLKDDFKGLDPANAKELAKFENTLKELPIYKGSKESIKGVVDAIKEGKVPEVKMPKVGVDESTDKRKSLKGGLKN